MKFHNFIYRHPKVQKQVKNELQQTLKKIIDEYQNNKSNNCSNIMEDEIYKREKTKSIDFIKKNTNQSNSGNFLAVNKVNSALGASINNSGQRGSYLSGNRSNTNKSGQNIINNSYNNHSNGGV